MARIDDATVQRILDAADIVDVVSDYVSLKRRGSGYIGLCPFHNERTPSFSVSKTKGLCKCFSCGKGGSPVSFIMEIEQMTYPEALRLLAKKYNIEIEERELSPEEREAATERESMMAANEFAMQCFERNLTSTSEGRDIGLSYFRERGINDAMVKKFHLGYSLEQRDALYQTALARGFNPEYLEKTGLCMRNERGEWRDRFRERVIFPVFTVSGKVVAFGGRTLRSDKTMAKYVNSIESIVYHKSLELYGLYQAKPEIVRKDKCILVEGYMDVISMHQAGITNVVASSGTSLTEGQIRLIHRFTENVTVIYDSDPAGIKASLRGIDMLLAEGLKIKVLLLPEGDDPDSFAQSHSSAEVERYIAEHESDFIQFKTRILLEGTDRDPQRRAEAINEIVKTISVVPEPMLRTMYIAECSRTFGVAETLLTLQVNKLMAQSAEKAAADEQRARARKSGRQPAESAPAGATTTSEPATDRAGAGMGIPASGDALLAPYERELLRYALRYGMRYLCDLVDADGNTWPMNVIEYIIHDMAGDEMTFTHEPYRRAFEAAVEVASSPSRAADEERHKARLREEAERAMEAGVEKIRNEVGDMASLQAAEERLREQVEADFEAGMAEYSGSYIARVLSSSADDTVRNITLSLVSEKHRLSKIHTKYAKVETEEDKLKDLVPQALLNLKEAIIEREIRSLQQKMREAFEAGTCTDADLVIMMRELGELNVIKMELARYLGERTVAPRFSGRRR
ncbi:MAG: DNA primase [Bacteroides sp.]|nr:DNA primase [Bacteroides sp.]